MAKITLNIDYGSRALTVTLYERDQYGYEHIQSHDHVFFHDLVDAMKDDLPPPYEFHRHPK